jgi:hypothetical protein
MEELLVQREKVDNKVRMEDQENEAPEDKWEIKVQQAVQENQEVLELQEWKVQQGNQVHQEKRVTEVMTAPPETQD